MTKQEGKGRMFNLSHLLFIVPTPPTYLNLNLFSFLLLSLFLNITLCLHDS